MSDVNLHTVFPSLNSFWDKLNLHDPHVVESHSGRLNPAKASEFFDAVQDTREHLFLHKYSSKKILQMWQHVLTSFAHSKDVAEQTAKFEKLNRECEEEESLISAIASFAWDDQERIYERLEEIYFKKYNCGVRQTFVEFFKNMGCPANFEDNIARYARLRKTLDDAHVTSVHQAFVHMLAIKSSKIVEDQDFRSAITSKSKSIRVRALTSTEIDELKIDPNNAFNKEYKSQCAISRLFCQECDSDSLVLQEKDVIVATHKGTQEEYEFHPILKPKFQLSSGFPVFHFPKAGNEVVSKQSKEFVLNDFENLFVHRELSLVKKALAKFHIGNSDLFKAKFEKRLGKRGLGELNDHQLSVFICHSLSSGYALKHSDLSPGSFTFDLTANGLNQQIRFGLGFDVTYMSNVLFAHHKCDEWNFLNSWPEFLFESAFFLSSDALLDRIRFMNVANHYVDGRNTETHLVKHNPHSIQMMPFKMVKEKLWETVLKMYKDFVASFHKTTDSEVLKPINLLEAPDYKNLMFPKFLNDFQAWELSEKQV
jgi:hypothetical protein